VAGVPTATLTCSALRVWRGISLLDVDIRTPGSVGHLLSGRTLAISIPLSTPDRSDKGQPVVSAATTRRPITIAVLSKG
jgi:hypothetical protein